MTKCCFQSKIIKFENEKLWVVISCIIYYNYLLFKDLYCIFVYLSSRCHIALYLIYLYKIDVELHDDV